MIYKASASEPITRIVKIGHKDDPYLQSKNRARYRPVCVLAGLKERNNAEDDKAPEGHTSNDIPIDDSLVCTGFTSRYARQFLFGEHG